MRNINPWNLRVKNVFLFDILKMSKDIGLFNLIQDKLLLEEMLNLMKNILACETDLALVASSNPSLAPQLP